jgi:glycolate oxidase iron-sulfur subunit
MRAVHLADAAVDDDFIASMETCVQCRGCEPACPSGVPFGHLIEATRATLAAPGGQARPPWWQRLAMSALGHHRALLAGSILLAVAQRTRLVPSRRLGLPARLPLRRPALRSSELPNAQGAVWLYTGCVMDAWQRDVHVAVSAPSRRREPGFASLTCRRLLRRFPRAGSRGPAVGKPHDGRLPGRPHHHRLPDAARCLITHFLGTDEAPPALRRRRPHA